MRLIRAPLLAALAIGLLWAEQAEGRSLFWPQHGSWWGDHEFRHKHQRKHAQPDLAKKTQLKDDPKGSLQIIISIANQRISLYENGAMIARSSVSTGVEGHPTPFGVFSVISKQRWHRSNIYSDAPMPYMQRITWSGIALHAGHLPGYPASHGCIRLTNDFAIRLWHLTKRGTRVIIAHEDVRPVEISNPHLFVSKSKVASGSPDSGAGAAALAGNEIVAAAVTQVPSAETQGTKVPDPPFAAPQKILPISVFVSRKLSMLFVRQGFTPLFDAPVKIQNVAEPIGTHVFSATEFQNEGAAIRWTVVSIPERSPHSPGSSKLRKAQDKRSTETISSIPDQAKAALERIEMPQDVVERVSELLTPGSSLIISDHGMSNETGADTDFIVETR